MVRGAANYTSPHTTALLAGWKAESEGKTPWEAAQVMAFEVLSQICQQHGDALTGSAASVFPWVDPSTTNWEQRSQNALIKDRDE